MRHARPLQEICTAQTPVRGQLRDVHVPEECPAEVGSPFLPIPLSPFFLSSFRVPEECPLRCGMFV